MKKTKLTFELLFIFVLPLLIMLFNVEFIVNPSSDFQLNSLVYHNLFTVSTSPIYSLFELLGDVLVFDVNHVFFRILIDYVMLFFIMFIIWHIFYCLFDMFVHLFKTDKKGE